MKLNFANGRYREDLLPGDYTVTSHGLIVVVCGPLDDATYRYPIRCFEARNWGSVSPLSNEEIDCELRGGKLAHKGFTWIMEGHSKDLTPKQLQELEEMLLVCALQNI